jgi:alpha-methylacyl-CoA racemase
MAGALEGVRVLELPAIGPVPFLGMLLADLGAEVIRIDRLPGATGLGDALAASPLGRGRRSIGLDLRKPGAAEVALKLSDTCDALIEGFRPGVAERLGIGPAEVLDRNPRLVYGRMTGWGQDGPLAQRAGHDINYIGLTGGLNAFRVEGSRPVPPLNMYGDFGGGSLYLVMGILAALFERNTSGRGQVVDGAIVDGTASLLQMVWNLRAAGIWSDDPATNLLDTGAPFYDTYECADGRYVALGSLEPQFYAALLEGLGLTGEELPAQHDRDGWPVLRKRFTELFASRTRDEWAAHFADTDACVTPVLSFDEVPAHPHIAARGTVADIHGTVQAAPAPRFSRSDPGTPGLPAAEPTPVADVLAAWRR